MSLVMGFVTSLLYNVCLQRVPEDLAFLGVEQPEASSHARIRLWRRPGVWSLFSNRVNGETVVGGSAREFARHLRIVGAKNSNIPIPMNSIQ